MKEIYVPVGTSDFREIREEEYYYIDNTGLIKELLNTKGTKVTLFTRPRRFGKTLGMSMLAHFFDIRENSRRLFDGLKISDDKELCGNWMNQYPTIFVSFKDINGLEFSAAYERLQGMLVELFKKYEYLLKSDEVYDDGCAPKWRELPSPRRPTGTSSPSSFSGPSPTRPTGMPQWTTPPSSAWPPTAVPPSQKRWNAQNEADIEVSYNYKHFHRRGSEQNHQMILLANSTSSKFYNPITEYLDSLESTPEGRDTYNQMKMAAFTSGEIIRSSCINVTN